MSIKTTAINKANVAVTMQSGKVGNVRYVQRNGETYVRAAYNKSKASTVSDGQMLQRFKFASMNILWPIFEDKLVGAFSKKESNQSDYNAFSKVNLGKNYVFLTKDMVSLGNCVALPVMISDGRLKSIGYTVGGDLGDELISDIETTLSIGATTTVGALATNLIQHNDNLKQGDELSFIGLVQGGTAEEPTVELVSSRIKLDPRSSVLCKDLIGFAYTTDDETLGVEHLRPGCYGYFHSRRDAKGFKISSQTLYNFNEAMIASLTSDEAYADAVASYNVVADESWVRPGDSEGDEPFDAEKVLISLKVKNNTGGTVKIDNGEAGVTAEKLIEKGSSATITAIAASGYSFEKWSDGSTAAERLIVASAAGEFTASFIED